MARKTDALIVEEKPEQKPAPAAPENVTNTTMPADLIPHQEAFELVGFSFGPIVGNEYSDVRIPDGWTRTSTGDYKVDLHDEQGRLRVEVRRKTAQLLPRYRIVESHDQPGVQTWMVKDGDAILYRASCGSHDFGSQDQNYALAERWLRLHYARSDDPVAHW